MRHSNRQAGFTLVELVIVLAITSLLALIALAGQHQLQIRERFDASVDKTIQNIAYARTYSQSNVNNEGNGDDPNSEVVGSVLEFDNNHYAAGYTLEELVPVYATPLANGYPDLSSLSEVPSSGIGSCPAAQHPMDNTECFEDFLPLSDNTVTYGNPSSPPDHVGLLAFINTAQGLEVCHQTTSGAATLAAACAASRAVPFKFVIKDTLDSLSATIQVDPVSGFAKRLN